jgi:UDP-N-acetylmuramyl pentapeptide phosphotransferase/UDP-N-acetylglucosamine-1-phosphate transferase
MIEVVVAFFPALFLGWLILRFREHHEAMTGDTIAGGPQKIHITPVPRVGGVMIFAGVAAGIAVASARGNITWQQAAFVVLCGAPAFACGLFEDLTKHGGVIFRLLATFVSAGSAFWLLGARVDRLDIALVDDLLQFLPFSLAVTMFMAAGVSQSINIIDGLNGLAAFVASAIFAAIGFVAWKLGDGLVLSISLASLGALLGFFVWNFPRGLIFCGDGGAYFVGFVIAEVSVLLVHRHREVSAWFPLVVVAYPVWETLFSIYRRRLVSRKAAMRPDALHFHSLVYRWVTRLSLDHRDRAAVWRRNARSSMICWSLPALASVSAVCLWDQTWMLTFAAVGFAFLYVLAYREMVSRKNWRRVRRGRNGKANETNDSEMSRAGVL